MIPAKVALVEKYQKDPVPYLLGNGDVIGYEELISISVTQNEKVVGRQTVNEAGLINFSAR